jgi:hypothetical protein
MQVAVHMGETEDSSKASISGQHATRTSEQCFVGECRNFLDNLVLSFSYSRNSTSTQPCASTRIASAAYAAFTLNILACCCATLLLSCRHAQVRRLLLHRGVGRR